MLSKNLVKVEIDDDTLVIYNSLVGDLVFSSQKELESILSDDVSLEERQALFVKGIYVNKESDDLLRTNAIRDHYRKKWDVLSLS